MMKRTIFILPSRLRLVIIAQLSPPMMCVLLIGANLRRMRRVSVFMKVEVLMIRVVSVVIQSSNFSELVMRCLSYLPIFRRL